MNKPTVFFSHSSRDAVLLTKLRDLVLAKTGNSVRIFLSSDGQSIPFGRNWVHSVEEALNEAKLMFVFLSPSGLAKPGWVNFESGHAYSRGIQVVPVGVFGVRIEHVPPPLSLLQGFNVIDPSSASNIIAVINRTCDVSHPEDITSDEFNRIFVSSDISSLSIFGDLTAYVDELRVHSKPCKEKVTLQDQLKAVDDYLSKKEIEHSYTSESSTDTLTAHGITFKCQYGDIGPYGMTINIDPLTSRFSLSLLDSIRHLILSLLGAEETVLSIILTEHVHGLSEAHRITSRLYNTEVSLLAAGDYQFKNCNFRIVSWYDQLDLTIYRRQSQVSIHASATKCTEIPLRELLKILFDSGVLFVSGEDRYMQR